jgi:4-diphosphocytidyl-2-C-methyl-D-erythritol kinase
VTSASGDGLSVAAPAKLNLYLHITGKRPDGYHELDSLITFAALHDTLFVTPDERFSVAVAGPFGAALTNAADENLIARAARLLAEAAGIQLQASVRLYKRLPVAAGVGGGSSDAAAALRALATLWRLSPDKDELFALALRLGADVPVCLMGRTAFVGGIGERLEPGPVLPGVGLVLVNPGIPLSTAEVFGNRGGPCSVPGRFEAAPADAASLARSLAARRNDLEAPAIALAPAIASALDGLAAAPGCRLARMTGSGATCFGLFDSAAAAARAARALKSAWPDWWVEASTLVNDIEALTPSPPVFRASNA